MGQRIATIAVCLLIATGTGCDRDQATDRDSKREQEQTKSKARSDETPALAEIDRGLKSDVVSHYADLAESAYLDAFELTEHLHESVEFLTEDPSEDALDAARQSWLAAREPYVRAEAFHFPESPIHRDGRESRVNAWPLVAAFVDSVEGEPDAGLINDPDIDVDEDSLAELNGRDDNSRNVATGFHVIEFLLWGQDLHEGDSGERPYTDYVTGPEKTAPNPERRGAYLRTTVELLLHDLDDLVAAWRKGDDNFRAEFTAQDSRAAIADILTGLEHLSRATLANKRLKMPLASPDREDESSNFSDNTHVDLLENARAVRDTYMGQYVRMDNSKVAGPGLNEIAGEVAPELDDRLERQFDQTIEAVEAIPRPFDEALNSDAGRAKIQTAIEHAQAQAKLLRKLADALGVELPR